MVQFWSPSYGGTPGLNRPLSSQSLFTTFIAFIIIEFRAGMCLVTHTPSLLCPLHFSPSSSRSVSSHAGITKDPLPQPTSLISHPIRHMFHLSTCRGWRSGVPGKSSSGPGRFLGIHLHVALSLFLPFRWLYSYNGLEFNQTRTLVFARRPIYLIYEHELG